MYSKHKKKVVFLAAVVIFLAVSSILYIQTKEEINIETDMAEVNRIYKETTKCLTESTLEGTQALHTAKTWETLTDMSFLYEFTIVDLSHEICYQSGDMSDDGMEAAIKNHHAYYPLLQKETLVGYLLIDTGYREEIRRYRETFAISMCLLTAVLLAGVLAVWGYLEHYVVAPFQKLKKFAASVAAGNLDIPLQTDKRRIFGDFTESFDILREELKKARQKEYEANISKKELVATLSHDIKTPITSIKLISEVLMVKHPEGELSAKLSSIYQKAEQIDSLVTDMFHSTLEELGELKVHCREVESHELASMLESADFYGKLEKSQTPPACLLWLDSLRIQQVIGNIVNNSYKYANTGMWVTYELKGNYLYMRIGDYGKGVAEEELAHIFQKFYRGSHAKEEEKSGAGLGLYICRDLMDKMEGEIRAENLQKGFCIELAMKLC